MRGRQLGRAAVALCIIPMREGLGFGGRPAVCGGQRPARFGDHIVMWPMCRAARPAGI